jgi:hypothetical protein
MTMAAVVSPGTDSQPPKGSMTTKEWIIPPRPKPGRKPATDTPPTKRKAQNRAAQRAFRERRAARVGELEEQLDHQKEEHDTSEKELLDKIRSLETELQTFRSKCAVLDDLLERERQDRVKVEAEAERLRRKWDEETHSSQMRLASLSGYSHTQPDHNGQLPLPHSGSSHGAESVMMTGKPMGTRQHNQAFSIAQIISPPDPLDIEASVPAMTSTLSCGSCTPDGPCPCADEVLARGVTGCGNCTTGSTCECLEATLKIVSMPDLKRPAPMLSIAPNEKRLRSESSAGRSSIETDFTSMFSKNNTPKIPISAPFYPISESIAGPSTIAIPPADGCGFCKEGTYCPCADASLAVTSPLSDQPMAYTQPLSYSQQTRTPPPSETDAVPPPMEVTSTGAIKLRSVQPPQNRTPLPSARRGCGPDGPGSCAQCKADPKSGLFCRSLAANFERLGGDASRGCCGGAGSGGACCKTKSGGAAKKDLGLSLSCAEAYKTLSGHRHFEEAADDISSWLPKLRAVPKTEPGATPTPTTPSRLPIEVEVASIMSVIKDFDVRFGK